MLTFVYFQFSFLPRFIETSRLKSQVLRSPKSFPSIVYVTFMTDNQMIVLSFVILLSGLHCIFCRSHFTFCGSFACIFPKRRVSFLVGYEIIRTHISFYYILFCLIYLNFFSVPSFIFRAAPDLFLFHFISFLLRLHSQFGLHFE